MLLAASIAYVKPARKNRLERLRAFFTEAAIRVSRPGTPRLSTTDRSSPSQTEMEDGLMLLSIEKASLQRYGHSVRPIVRA